jgi:CRP-like cAMP-binding protein
MVKGALIRFSYFLQKSTFKFKQRVYREGTDAKWVYLVYKGSFELSKELTKVQKQSQLFKFL